MCLARRTRNAAVLHISAMRSQRLCCLRAQALSYRSPLKPETPPSRKAKSYRRLESAGAKSYRGPCCGI